MKRPTVQKAINHWTNRARLKGPEAQELFGDASPEAPRLRSVLAKISRLSAAFAFCADVSLTLGGTGGGPSPVHSKTPSSALGR